MKYIEIKNWIEQHVVVFFLLFHSFNRLSKTNIIGSDAMYSWQEDHRFLTPNKIWNLSTWSNTFFKWQIMMESWKCPSTKQTDTIILPRVYQEWNNSKKITKLWRQGRLGQLLKQTTKNISRLPADVWYGFKYFCFVLKPNFLIPVTIGCD